MPTHEVTEQEWQEACENWKTAETVFFYMQEYYEKGWLSEEGYKQACAAYGVASVAHDEVREAYMADGLSP